MQIAPHPEFVFEQFIIMSGGKRTRSNASHTPKLHPIWESVEDVDEIKQCSKCFKSVDKKKRVERVVSHFKSCAEWNKEENKDHLVLFIAR